MCKELFRKSTCCIRTSKTLRFAWKCEKGPIGTRPYFAKLFDRCVNHNLSRVGRQTFGHARQTSKVPTVCLWGAPFSNKGPIRTRPYFVFVSWILAGQLRTKIGPYAALMLQVAIRFSIWFRSYCEGRELWKNYSKNDPPPKKMGVQLKVQNKQNRVICSVTGSMSKFRHFELRLLPVCLDVTETNFFNK